METTTILAEGFMRAFSGMDRAYGTYDLSRSTSREDGKQQGRAITKTAPVTMSLWEQHLLGKGPGLGIIPIRDGNDCNFGAIDVDAYQGLNLRDIVAKLQRASIPLIVCRSKSGGAHIYCFAKIHVPASTMKAKLGEVASFLGFGGSEIFPKQSSILSEQGDIGQWINMPYFNGVRGMRYAVDIEGNALSAEQFLMEVEKVAVTPDFFKQIIVLGDKFSDGPPCLQALSQVGYPDGTRNNGLYNIGVYLKRAFPDTWEQKIDDYNHEYMMPPIPMVAVQGVVKSLKKKEYQYKCSDQPIAQHCNASLCRSRKHGVGSSTNGRFPMLGGLTKLDTKPPIWFWTIDGTRIELTTSELQDPRLFQRKCMEYLNIMPQVLGNQAWQAAVQHAMDGVVTVEAPKDGSITGQFWEMVEQFCTSRAQALTREEMVLGKPFSDNGRTYFRMKDLIAYLTRNKFHDFKTHQITSMMKDAGAEHHFSNLKGVGTNYWSIPAFARQSESFVTPKEVKGLDAF